MSNQLMMINWHPIVEQPKRPSWSSSPASRSIVHLDLELAGTLDLREVGVDAWARHPDTTLILVGYAIDDGPVYSFEWAPLPWPVDQYRFLSNATIRNAALTVQYDLMLAVADGAQVHAWNATFEHTVWNTIMVRDRAPILPLEQCHCVMAAASNAGLPMALEDAAPAVGAPHVKDKAGRANMVRMARPRGYEPDGTPRWWHKESVPKLDALKAYNIADVEAERDIHKRIPRMTQYERDLWLLDQRMNNRGMPVDLDLVHRLETITEEELRHLNREIRQLTRGQVTNSAQHSRLLLWLTDNGYTRHDLQKDTLKDFISSTEFYDMPSEAQKVLILRAEAAKTSTAKLKKLRSFAWRDGRARHLVQYAGATRTLRWAGRGPQIQNFPRPSFKRVDRAIEEIEAGMPNEGLRAIFGKPLDVVASCLRGAFKAPPGQRFVVCDFHAIEAIVIAWLADFQDMLDVFRRKEDIYIFTAASVGSQNRQFGKVLRLALGYQMGPDKFRKTAEGQGIMLSIAEAIDAVMRFRKSNKPIVALWHRYEEAARKALSHQGQSFPVGRIKFRMAKKDGRAAGSLLIEKPSGGTLVYRDATLDNGRICYWGVHQTTRQWTKIDTYGGKLVENVTQAVARDLLAEAMKNFDAIYPSALLSTIHDEIVAISPAAMAQEMLSDLRQIMSNPPSWGEGLPLSAAGYVAERYAKA